MATRAYRRDSKGRFAGGGGGRVTYGKAGGFKPGNNLGGRPAPKRGKSFAARIRATPGGRTAVRAGAGVLTVAGATALTMGAGAAGSALARRAVRGKVGPQPGLYRMKGPGAGPHHFQPLSPLQGKSLREASKLLSVAKGGSTGYRIKTGRAEAVSMGPSGKSLRDMAKAAGSAGGSVYRGAGVGQKVSTGRSTSLGYGFAVKGAGNLGGGSLGGKRRRR